jgi:hypothetical protein
MPPKEFPISKSKPLGGAEVSVLRSTPISTERAAEKLHDFLKNDEAAKHLDGDHTALLQNLTTAIKSK